LISDAPCGIDAAMPTQLPHPCKREWITCRQLQAFSSHPHGRIPVFSLTRGEIDDLIAYIETVD
jgi:hypothetical protein